MAVDYGQGNIQLVGVNFNNPSFKMVGGMSIDDIKIKYNWFLNAEVENAIIGENHYPLIEHHDGQDLFIIIVPFYNNKNNTISLLECDILKDKDHCFIITDNKEPLIKKIVDTVSLKT